MGLIYGKKIPLLRKGYPTVSDKYNVASGRLEGSVAAEMGQLLEYGSQSGLFKVATDATKVCGVALASNVKLTDTWTNANAATMVKPGEAANLCFHGFVAVKVGEHSTAEADAAIIAAAAPGAPCYCVKDSAGNLVVTTNTGETLLPGFFFTGVAEVVGAEILAEIEIRQVVVAAE